MSRDRDWDALVLNEPTPGCAVCDRIACVCALKSRHADDCRFRIAATCAVGIECDHGRDCCPICDPCTCGAGVSDADFGPQGKS